MYVVVLNPFAAQSFIRTLLESGETYLQVEQERDQLRAKVEQLDRKNRMPFVLTA